MTHWRKSEGLLLALLTAFMIHFFSSTVPSSVFCASEAPAGAGSSCMAARNSEASS